MNNREYLDLIIDYMVSKKMPDYLLAADGTELSAGALRAKAEMEINAMSRCEYLIAFADDDDMKMFHEKQKLARGETLTKTYIVTIPKDAELQSTDA